jgi:hypothetical protein
MSYSRFDSESAWREAILQITSLAAREIRLLDRDLTTMRLDSAAALDAIERFLAQDSTRRVHIALHNPQPLLTQLPRLLRFAQRVEHAFLVRHIPEEFRHLTDCHLLADGRHGTRRFHADHPRGSLVLDDEREIAPWWRRFDELWELSTPVSLGGVTGL